jgi:hypothetical protein
MVLGDRDTKLVRLDGPDYDAEPGGWSSKIAKGNVLTLWSI